MSATRQGSLIVSAARLLGAGAGTELSVTLEADSALIDIAEASGVLRVDARIVRGDGGVVALGEIDVDVTVHCRRCLEQLVLHGSFPLEGWFLVPGSTETDSKSRDYDPDAFVLAEGGALDLADLVRQTVIASVPPNPLCRPDCAGLCPVCGNNLNERDCGCREYDVDPRLAPLKALMAEMLARPESEES